MRNANEMHCLTPPKRPSLEHFGTTHEACLLVFVLAGASSGSGRTLEEIIAHATEVSGGTYEDPAEEVSLHMARYYLSQTGHLEYAPRVKYLPVRRHGGAVDRVPVGREPAWRRTSAAEPQAPPARQAAAESLAGTNSNAVENLLKRLRSMPSGS